MNEQTIAKAKELAQTIKTATDPAVKSQAIKDLVSLMAKDLEPEAKQMVDVIEKKPETTRNRYGDYMHALTGQKGIYLVALAQAMKNVGGNVQGINDALGVMKGGL